METYNSQPYVRLHHLILLGLNNSKTKIDLKVVIIYHINEQHQLDRERYSHRQIGHVFDRLIVGIQIEIRQIMMKNLTKISELYPLLKSFISLSSSSEQDPKSLRSKMIFQILTSIDE